jgi:ATP-binding cassette subfamily B protein
MAVASSGADRSKATIGSYLNEWVGAFSQTPQVVKLVWRAHPFAALALFILTVISGPLPALDLYCGKKVFDGVTLWLQGNAAGGRNMLVLFLAGGFGVKLMQGGLWDFNFYLQRLVRMRLSHTIQDRILTRAATLDMAFFETPSFYDKLQRAQSEADSRPMTLLFTLTFALRDLVGMGSCIAVLATLSGWTIPYLVLLTVPSLVIRIKYGRRGFMMRRGRTSEERRMRYYQDLLTSRSEAKELRLFGLADYLISRWRDIFRQFYRQDRRLEAKLRLANLAAGVLQAAAEVGFYVFAIHRTITDPAVTLGSLYMFTGAFRMASGQMSSLFGGISEFYEHHLYLSNLFEFLAQEPKLCAPANPAVVPVPISRGIRLESVTFAYPGSHRNALEDVTFEIRPGERVAIVGENGAGKTTLVKLLTRLHDPQRGRITVDGIDLRDLVPSDWQKQIGVIFQDFARYSLTARENVGFGQLNYVEDMSRIRSAGDLSGASDCIERLEHRWETVLGKVFDEAQDLSVGEWQKVALARAFLREAQILVLDEPTASLDAKQEYEIFAKFNEVTRGKMTILISHRFSTVRKVDRIFVIERGRLIEAGSHDELMTLNNRYAELFSRQASAYH